MRDGAFELVLVHKRGVNHKVGDTGGEELGNLRRDIDHRGIIQVRAPVDVGCYGQHLAIDVAKPKWFAAQETGAAVVDAGVGDLKDAVLAGHNARLA